MIKIGDKVRCIKDIILGGEVIVKAGTIGIIEKEIIKGTLYAVEWEKDEFKLSKKGDSAIWCADLYEIEPIDKIELVEYFESKSIQIDDDGVLFWNDGNGDEIIGNVKYLDRDVLIDVFKTLVGERDDYEAENDILKNKIEDLTGKIYID